MTYGFLLESVWHPPLLFAGSTEPLLPPKLELQALWFDGSLGRQFRTSDGREVRVVRFGEWNRMGGPDFRQVVLELDGHEQTGSVVVDSQSTSWQEQGRASAPEFDDVLLHVAFRAGPSRDRVVTASGREVPQLVIGDSELADAMSRPQRDIAIAHPGRCVFPLRKMSKASIERLLAEAAQIRAARKASRWLRIAEAHGRDQALFLSAAETLGYRGNGLAMRLLAQHAPLSLLEHEGEGVEPLLLGVAGFLAPYLHELARPDAQNYRGGLWEYWQENRARFELSPERSIRWKLADQRPANHPHRRIGALSALLQQWDEFKHHAFAEPFDFVPLARFLNQLEHPFWSYRHTLNSPAGKGSVSLFGRAQAIDLAASHLAPLAMQEGRLTWRDYKKLKHSASNHRVQECGLRLFGDDKRAKEWSRRVYHQQGLIQVYQDFCLEDFSDCHECPFAEQLQHWR